LGKEVRAELYGLNVSQDIKAYQRKKADSVLCSKTTNERYSEI